MSGFSSFRWALVSLTFTGSLLSVIGSGCILLCYLALPHKRHFRHVLILNLAVADFLNSLNNTSSGAQILIHKKDLKWGPGCILNGLVGQITVQATDCSILAIAIVTVYTITQTSSSRLIQGEWEWPLIIGATLAIWTLPFITGFLALAKEWYAPVSGNWCWLTNEPVYLRYVLTHGWRYLFMLLEIILYTYLHFYLRRHFRRLAVPIVSNTPSSNPTTQSIPLTPVAFTTDSKRDLQLTATPSENEISPVDDFEHKRATITIPAPDDSAIANGSEKQKPLSHIWAHRRVDAPNADENTNNNASRSTTNPRQRAIQRVLLLNAYPLLYILLWIPGLANRIVEASGNKSKVTQIMQASTQFVGLANALTYGWNERIAAQIKEKFWSRRRP